MELVKHRPGAPLTAREHEQRRDAARARWKSYATAATAASAVGAVSGAAIATGINRTIAARQAQVRGAVRAHLTPVVEESAARQMRIAARAERVRRRLSGRRTVPQSLKTLVSHLREQRVQGQRDIEDIARSPQFVPEAGALESPGAAAAELEENLAPLASEITDLRANFQPPRNVAVRGSEQTVEGYHRRGVQRSKLVPPEDPRFPEGTSGRGFSRHALTRTERLALLAELRAEATTATDPDRQIELADMLDRLERPRRVQTRTRGADVSSHRRQMPTHIRRVEGYPDRAAVQRLRDRVVNLLGTKEARLRETEQARRAQRVAGAKSVIRLSTEQRNLAGAIERVLRERSFNFRLLRSTGRAALLGSVVGLTAAGIGAIAHHVVTAEHRRRRLAKARRATPEQDMGARLARVYRDWIDRLLGKTDKPVNLADDIAQALAPGLTQAFAEGASQPPDTTEVPTPGPGPNWRIDVDFDVLNPSVRRHMAEYALDRIVEITNDQREAIRTALMQQSVLQGIGPKDVARTIRQSIGLTTYQMAMVQGFRSMLVALDPRALERKLRDRRYDRTLRKAIATGTPLTEAQIDAMTDAYYRRMLAFRAETIARTEAIRATSYGAVARAQDVLDNHPELDVIKSWIATDDERTRDTHAALNGKEVQGMLTPFLTIHNNLIRWPCDQEAVADEVIRCRCALGFRFIPKRGQLMAVAV